MPSLAYLMHTFSLDSSYLFLYHLCSNGYKFVANNVSSSILDNSLHLTTTGWLSSGLASASIVFMGNYMVCTLSWTCDRYFYCSQDILGNVNEAIGWSTIPLSVVCSRFYIRGEKIFCKFVFRNILRRIIRICHIQYWCSHHIISTTSVKGLTIQSVILSINNDRHKNIIYIYICHDMQPSFIYWNTNSYIPVFVQQIACSNKVKYLNRESATEYDYGVKVDMEIGKLRWLKILLKIMPHEIEIKTIINTLQCLPFLAMHIFRTGVTCGRFNVLLIQQYVCDHYPLLLTWINFNPSMDK